MKRWKKRLVALALAAAACVSFAAPVSAGWKKDSAGWWYETAAGSSLRGVWEKIDGFWYCFDENGYMKTGWEWWEGGWYYLTPDYVSRYPAGAMLIDAEIVSDGKLYALDRGGRMLKNLTHTGGGYSYRFAPAGSVTKHRTADMYRFSVPEGWRILDQQAMLPLFLELGGAYLLYPEACQADIDRGEQPAVMIRIYESPAKPEEWNSSAASFREGMFSVSAGETLTDACECGTAAEAAHQLAYRREIRGADGEERVEEAALFAQDYLSVGVYFEAPETAAEAYREDFRAFADSFVLLPEEEIPVLLENRYGDGAVWEFDGRGYRLRRADGSYAAGWVCRDGCWYYLGEDGYRRTGWLELADGTYYLKEDGRMITGAAQIGGQLCTFGGDGRLLCREALN